MSKIKRQIRSGSRDWRVLAKVAAVIIGFGVILAVGIDKVRDKSPLSLLFSSAGGVPEEMIEALSGEYFAGDDPDVLAKQLLSFANFRLGEGDLEWVETDSFVPEALAETPVAFYEKGLFGGEDERREIADQMVSSELEPGDSLAMGIAADLFWRLGNETRARELLSAVPNAENPSSFAVGRAVAFALSTRDVELAESLLDGRHQALIESGERRKLCTLSKRWGGVVGAIVKQELSTLTPAVGFIVLLTAGIWFWILHMFAGDRSMSGLPLFIVAVLLGVLSIVPTVLAIVYQQEVRGLLPTGEIKGDVAFYLFGVGLREEICKLLLFLPLLPWLIRRKNLADVAVAAAFVGLGFALLENVNYLHGDRRSSLGRFLTANFFHMSLTGIVGLSLYKSLCVRGGRIENFAIDLLLVIIAHAAYDLFITSPALARNLEGGSLVILALVVYRFLGLLYEHSPRRFQTVHPLGVFIVGSSFIVALTLNYALWDVPFTQGLGGFGQGVVGMLTVAALYINQFRDLP